MTLSALALVTAALIDVSGASLYWRVVDGVSTGRISADSGRALLATHPGYQQIERSGTRLRVIHHCLRLMTPGARRDTIPVPPSNRAWLYAYVCDHLDSVRAHRAELERFADVLANDPAEQARIAAAIDTARAYLPGAARAIAAPTIYAMHFEPGGFGGATIAVDLLRHLRRSQDERVGFFGHELHHVMMSALPSDLGADDPSRPRPAAVWWLGRLQWEGIASLIDKREYVRLSESGFTPAGDATGFALEHATRMREGAATLARVDSAFNRWLASTDSPASGSVPRASADSALRASLEASIPDGGHALGQYLAMAIEATGGRAAIVAASESRFAFVRAYQQVAQARPRRFRPLSERMVNYLARVEREFGRGG